MYQYLQHRLNIEPCILIALRLYRFVDYLLRFDFLNLILLLSMLMIQVLFRLLLLHFSTREPNTSKREAADKGFLTLLHVSNDLQIADVFTKSMARQHHQFLVGKLMLLDPPTLISGGMLV